MRAFLSLILLAVLLHQPMLKLGILGWYEINKDYIAKNLCENRDKPQLKCCGKCYVRKQMAKVDASTDNSERLPLLELLKLKLPPFVLPQTLQLLTFSESADRAAIPYIQPFAAAVDMEIINPPG